MTEVTQADRDFWDIYGAEIFHCAIHGAEVVAMVREQAEQKTQAVVQAARELDEFIHTTPDCQRPGAWTARIRALRIALLALPTPANLNLNEGTVV